MLSALLSYRTRIEACRIQWSVGTSRGFSIFELSMELLLLRRVHIVVVVEIILISSPCLRLAIGHVERLVSEIVARTSLAAYRIRERRHASLRLVKLITSRYLTTAIIVIH